MQNCSFASSTSPLNAASSSKTEEKGLGGKTPKRLAAEHPRPNGHFAATVTGSLGSLSKEEGLTDEQMVQLDQIFSFIDKNQDGKLTRKELLIALRKSGAVRALLNIPGHELVEVQADYEGQGRLGSAEAWWCSLTEEDALYRADFIKHFAEHPQQALKGILLLERPKFSATHEWQPVPKGAACPPGLEYKMDLATGETLARLCEQNTAHQSVSCGLFELEVMMSRSYYDVMIFDDICGDLLAHVFSCPHALGSLDAVQTSFTAPRFGPVFSLSEMAQAVEKMTKPISHFRYGTYDARRNLSLPKSSQSFHALQVVYPNSGKVQEQVLHQCRCRWAGA